MSTGRVNIATLMMLFVPFGMAVAAWKNLDETWATAQFSVTVLSLFIATLAARYSAEPWRTFWGGFAMAGWGYLTLSLAPYFAQEVRPRLLTTSIGDWVLATY